MSTTIDIKEVVKEKYGQAASRVTAGKSDCCGSVSPLASSCDPITSKLYSLAESVSLVSNAVEFDAAYTVCDLVEREGRSAC